MERAEEGWEEDEEDDELLLLLLLLLLEAVGRLLLRLRLSELRDRSIGLEDDDDDDDEEDV